MQRRRPLAQGIPSIMFGNHLCKYQDQDLELWYDRSQDLNYVRLRRGGIDKISQHYKAKYQPYFERNGVRQSRVFTFNFQDNENFYSDSVLARGVFSNSQDFHDYFLDSFSGINANESILLQVPFVNKYGYLMHVYPFILAKDSQGNPIIIDFDRVFQEGQTEFRGVKIVPVQNYKQVGHNDSGDPILNQNDFHSCSVFAVDVLKNCAIDPYFMQNIYSGHTHNTAWLDAMHLGQNSQIIDSLTEEKSFTYAHNNAQEILQNDKAFFKGHEYLKILGKQAEVQDSLSEKTKNLLESITQRRQEYRGVNLDHKIDNEGKYYYYPHTSFKAINALSPGAGNIWHKEKQLHPQNFRGNNFKVLPGVYDSQDHIYTTIRDILMESAYESDLTFKGVKAAIVIAKRDGGVAHALNLYPQEGQAIYRQNSFDDQHFSAEDIALFKKFSAKFQKKCAECGIYSGREGSDKGLRLTFLPDNVVKEVSEMNDDLFRGERACNEHASIVNTLNPTRSKVRNANSHSQ